MASSKPKSQRLPKWIRTTIQRGENRDYVRGLVDNLELHTVCKSAKCPNLAECWHCKTATVMILGDRCTRRCRFCAVPTGGMLPADPEEPDRVALAVQKMELRFVVLTSVDRDDLVDYGAQHWCDTLRAIYKHIPHAGTEILTPDFQGNHEFVEQVIEANPVVFNHNLETCARLTKEIRSGNQYDRSLDVLKTAFNHGNGRMAVKSGIMVGLGETNAEVLTCIRDIRETGATILTVGQYLRPSREQCPVDRYVEPEIFEEWAEFAYSIGFKAVSSGPMVRSSFKAEDLARKALNYEGADWSAR